MVRSVYLAGPYERKSELRLFAELIQERGHLVTSEWLTNPEWPDEALDPMDPKVDFELCCGLAFRDQEGVRASDILIIFSEGNGRGGRNVELGMALEKNLEVIVVGPRTTIFHYLGDYFYSQFNQELLDSHFPQL